jgi:ammonium transporter Rh
VGNWKDLKVWAAVFLVISIIVGIALVPELNKYANVVPPSPSENAFMYEKSMDILVMLLIGFGFLMVFVKKYGFSSLTATFLLVALSLPLYMLIRPYLWGNSTNLSVTSISMLLFAEFSAASLLIAIGGPLGRINTHQYLLVGSLFTPLYALNEWLLLSGAVIPAGTFLDTAGSITIHAFGAYFAFGMIIMLTTKREREMKVETSKSNNQFMLLGTAALWIFWSSFCSALTPLDKIPLVATNTILALCGATLGTYALSTLIRGKIEVSDIANASLAGGCSNRCFSCECYAGMEYANRHYGWHNQRYRLRICSA